MVALRMMQKLYRIILHLLPSNRKIFIIMLNLLKNEFMEKKNKNKQLFREVFNIYLMLNREFQEKIKNNH